MGKSDLLSYGTTASTKSGGGRHIVCISGGLSSAWVTYWVRDNIEGEKIYYFNDTKWEHPDLYRFLNDISTALDIKITEDTDGRNPEEVFYDQKMLGNNRAPICSRVLKAERLQNFVKSGDTLYFGIEGSEIHRAARIAPIYARLGCECRFPMIDENIHKSELYRFINELGVEIPQLYKDGFQHNNCAGGCVRAGKRQWLSLLRTYPDIYAERERIEREFSKEKGKAVSFMKDMSLQELREAEEKQITFDFSDGDDEWQGECVGICGRMY